MKIIIYYSTKGGCTKECAEILKKFLDNSDDVTLFDVASGADPNICDYDLVLLGGGVRFGKLYKPMRAFIKKHEKELKDAPHILFLCCGFLSLAEEYLNKLFPASLSESAISLEYFGGELKPEKHHGLMKLVVRFIRNSIEDREEDNDLPDIIESNISMLATKIISGKTERSTK